VPARIKIVKDHININLMNLLNGEYPKFSQFRFVGLSALTGEGH
jgi:hypothetical protein